MAMPLAKKAIAPLAKGALSGLASLNVDEIFGKGQRGGFLVPIEKIAQLVAYKHLLTTGQKKDILKSLQTCNGLVITPTKTQQGGFNEYSEYRCPTVTKCIDGKRTVG